MEETATPQHCSSSLLQHYSTPLHHHNMFSTPAVPSGILRLEPLYPCTTLSLNNNPLLYNTAQQPRPVPQHLPFYPQLTHMKSAYDKTTTTTVVEEEEESEKDRRLSIDFLLHQDSRPALYRHNSNTTRQPPTYPQGDEDYQDVVPAVTNLVPPPFNLFSYPHNNHSNNYNDLHCYSSISNHNNHCNDDGTKHNLALPTFNGKKTRRRLRHEELYLLESVYAHNQTPDSFTKIKLSQLLYMTPQQVSNWFQNRRSRKRKALQYRKAKRLKMEQKLESQQLQRQLQQLREEENVKGLEGRGEGEGKDPKDGTKQY